MPNGSGGLCSGLPRVSYLQISCDTSANDGVIDSVTESQAVPCQYTIVYVLVAPVALPLANAHPPMLTDLVMHAACAPSGRVVPPAHLALLVPRRLLARRLLLARRRLLVRPSPRVFLSAPSS